jgi:hypothetical protein
MTTREIGMVYASPSDPSHRVDVPKRLRALWPAAHVERLAAICSPPKDAEGQPLMGNIMLSAEASKLAKKLNLKKDMQLRVLAKPTDLGLSGLALMPSANAEGIIAFVTTLADVKANSGPVVEAAKADRIAWLAYPKAGQLGTDLNRDILWQYMLKKGVQGVRQIAINDVWSAMRFRPKR